MIDKTSCNGNSGAGRRGSIRARGDAAASAPARSRSAVAATLLGLILVLPCPDLHAELLFRSAQPDEPQRWSELKRYSDPSHTAYPKVAADDALASPDEVQVIVSGFITEEDVASAKLMEALVKSGKQRIAANVVAFSSSGGEFDAAMDLGRLLRRLRVSTLVGRDEQCLSSCVFAFMGGDRRVAAGRIGIHRPYFSSTRYLLDRRVQYQQLQRKLKEYIEELDFPPSLYEAVMAVSSEAIQVLGPGDLKRFYLDGMSPSAEEEADAESARRLDMPIGEYLQRKAKLQPCSQAGGCAKEGASAGAAAHTRQDEASSPSGTTRGAVGLAPAPSNGDAAVSSPR